MQFYTGICTVDNEITTPVKNADAGRSLGQMVSLFGSAKQKRAFSAAQKNKVESDILETALESAFSHAQAAVEKTSLSG